MQSNLFSLEGRYFQRMCDNIVFIANASFVLLKDFDSQLYIDCKEGTTYLFGLA